MNPMIQFLIETKGIPESSIILLLMLPIVASIFAFWRQIIGLKTFGIYAPIVMTFSFYQLGLANGEMSFSRGIKYGIALALVVFISASLAHEVTRRIRLHYLPKMSIVLSFVSFAVFTMLILASYFDKEGFISIDTLPLLLMITVSEQMISMYIKKGRKKAIMMTIATVIIAIFTFGLISWQSLQEFMLKYPYVPILTLLFNFVIGKWTGFRLQEYLRFKTILKDESD